jgi:hypothetical protein
VKADFYEWFAHQFERLSYWFQRRAVRAVVRKPETPEAIQYRNEFIDGFEKRNQ